MTFEIELNGRSRTVSIERAGHARYRVTVDGVAALVDAQRSGDFGVSLLFPDASHAGVSVQLAPGPAQGEIRARLSLRRAGCELDGDPCVRGVGKQQRNAKVSAALRVHEGRDAVDGDAIAGVPGALDRHGAAPAVQLDLEGHLRASCRAASFQALPPVRDALPTSVVLERNHASSAAAIAMCCSSSSEKRLNDSPRRDIRRSSRYVVSKRPAM